MKCNEKQVRQFADGGTFLSADLAADWLEMRHQLDGWAANGVSKSSHEELVAERDSLRKRLADAEAFIRDQAENGGRFDDRPTRRHRRDETALEVESYFHSYLSRISDDIRDGARRFLDRAKEGK